MKTTILDTATDTYFVKFQNKSNGGFICTYSDIQEVLRKTKEGLFLSDIYRFNTAKLKFERVPKSKYNSVFGWNTEAMEFLKK